LFYSVIILFLSVFLAKLRYYSVWKKTSNQGNDPDNEAKNYGDDPVVDMETSASDFKGIASNLDNEDLGTNNDKDEDIV